MDGLRGSYIGPRRSHDAMARAANRSQNGKTLIGCPAVTVNGEPHRFRYDPTHLTSGLNIGVAGAG
jgi:hypothetical protein